MIIIGLLQVLIMQQTLRTFHLGILQVQERVRHSQRTLKLWRALTHFFRGKEVF